MKVSICQFTTPLATFEEDVAAYAAAGAEGIGICEFKLHDDSAALAAVREAGLAVTACVPSTPSILPLPLMDGETDPGRRVEALCAGVRRLAAFEPQCVLFLTGPGDDRAAVLDGIRQIANEGERAGVPVALEPIQREFRDFWTIPVSLAEAAELLEEAGRPDLPLVFDTWHLWNQPLEEIDRYRDRIVAVHVADWRQPTRNTNDRVLPGDGAIDFGPIFDALRWDGFYDLEIFSDPELPDSLWREDPRELARRGVEALRSVSA